MNGYKIIISNKNVYKEIELSDDVKSVSFGTKTNCDVRVRKDLFFDEIGLEFIYNNGDWNIICDDNLYIDAGDVRKLVTYKLTHGDIINICYQNTDNVVFSVEFLMDFESKARQYDRVISLANVQSISISSSETSNIVIKSDYSSNESVILEKSGDKYVIKINSSSYGIYHNGRKCSSGEIIKNRDFFSIADYSFYIKNGELWTECRKDMSVSGLQFLDKPLDASYPNFHRNARIKNVVDETKIEILDPSNKPEKPKDTIIQRLLPSLAMLVGSGVMAAFGSPTMIIFSGISAVMSVVTGIINIKQAKKEYKKEIEERETTYNKYIANKRGEIAKIRSEECSILNNIYVPIEEQQRRLESFSPELFDRTKEDDDFLCVRLGTGNKEAKREINYKKKEQLQVGDELQQIPEKMCEEYKYITGAPIVCDLKANNAIGVFGSEADRFNLFKNIITDIVSRHFYTDVKMIFVAKKENKKKVSWLRMLPHVYNEYIGIKNIVCDDESKNVIFEYLYKECTIRESNKSYDNRIIVFFYDEYEFKSHPVSKYVDKAKDLGITFIFFGDAKRDIPAGCGNLISLNGNNSGILINSEDASKSLQFTYTPISDNAAAHYVHILAPVKEEELSLESDLTKNITLFELLNIFAVDDLNLEARWNKSQVFNSMAAPLGVSKGGVVYLDLHDKAHGPHGLVAGTTGSGKSEILQTYILSMATLYHPYEVGFMIIDFKGGGMVNQFRDLPHLLGAITNIDGKEINRSLKSIKAELMKRQRYFASADVNHIDKYIKKYKNGEVSEPLPHLIIIVDEFAELKAEQPEFMKELISAARIGRSLGVHLILATQKPAGQVNEQIWSNSKFKLCLKVQSQEDSNEVLKSPLAAEIKEPGRAYLQVGNNEIFELFQSAYSGASEHADESQVKEFAIFNLTDSGKKIPIYQQKKAKDDDGNITQLDSVVKYVAKHCEDRNIPHLPEICLKSLDKNITYPADITKANAMDGIYADLGIYDDPDNQRQGQYVLDVSSQNTIIIGSAQSGKTNLLQTIIRSLTTKYSPEEVSIYIVDFASKILKNFEGLNHVGGVVTSSEDEKLKNLFKMLHGEIEKRKEKLLSIGVSSFNAYKEAGKTDMPQIVFIIDNMTALKELYFQDDDSLIDICRECISVGISVIMANPQLTGIGYKYLANFSSRIAFYNNDSSEYNSLFDHCREKLDDIHGRGFVSIDKVILECQMYLAFEGEKEIDRVSEIRKYINETNERYPKDSAKFIPVIPEILTMSQVKEHYDSVTKENGSIMIGLNYDNVSPVVFNMAELGVLAVSGKDGAGKTNFIKYVVKTLSEKYSGESEVYIIDGIKRRLADIKEMDNVARYDVMSDAACEVINTIEEKVRSRYEALAKGEEDALDNAPLLLVVLNSVDAMEAISANMNALDKYKSITGKYRNMKIAIILGNYDNVMIPYSAPEIVKRAKDAKHFLFFDDLSNFKIYDMPLSYLRKFKKTIELGDCYYINDAECSKIKSVLCD